MIMKFEGILERFPGLCVAEGTVSGLTIGERSSDLDAFKPGVYGRIRAAHTIENVKDDPGYRAYRDFFWRVGIDPTKTRPASEALVRRILAGNPLPSINTAVDAYNLASALCGVPIAAFDAGHLRGGLTMRMAAEGEPFHGIGMPEPIGLKPNQVVICDEAAVIAVYPYRDADASKVTLETRTVRLVSCGVPGIGPGRVRAAYAACTDLMQKYCGGQADVPTLSP